MKKAASLLLSLCLASALWPAPAKQGFILEFVSGKDLTVTAKNGARTQFGKGLAEGDAIAPGSVLALGKGTSAELRLQPNGSIVKLMPETMFALESLATPKAPDNVFKLVAGKVRVVAAKGTGEGYQVRTTNSVAGVRGTDFLVAVDPGKVAKILVKEGAVQYAKLDDSGREIEAILVEEGEEADAYDEDFEAEAYDEAEFEEYYEDADFEELDAEDLEEGDDDAEAEESEDDDEGDDSDDEGGDSGGDD